ncbi:MAG: hypothetical protein KGL78_09730 [Burkholderiales bacterium]|nr:hypothetical protein [Burkholderiales bacterium]
MKTTHRMLSLALAALLTLGVLSGIDHLAQFDAAPSALAQASQPRA